MIKRKGFVKFFLDVHLIEQQYIYIQQVKFLYSLFLFLIVYFPFAQSISVVSGLLNSEGKAIAGANVEILKTGHKTVSDSLGSFTLNLIPSGKYQLKVSCVGFENFQQEVKIVEGKSVMLNVELVPLTQKLKEVVVTGTMKEVRKSESITSVDVYTQKFFKRNPTTNIFDALVNINGIFPDVDNGVSNTTDVQINGLEGNYSMFLIDGVPAMNGLAGIYAINSLGMSAIDKVEILKGSSSTLYGSEAIAGVINIKTKNASTAPRFTANAMLNSMLGANADFSVSAKLKKANMFLSASGEASNFAWDIDGDKFMDVPLTNRLNVYNKWNFARKDNGTAFVYARYLFEDKIGGEKVSVTSLRKSSVHYSEAIRTHQWQAGFQYQLPVKEKFLLMADYSEHYQHANFGLNIYDGIQRTGFFQFTYTKRTDAVNEILLGVNYRASFYSDNTDLSAEEISDLAPLQHLAGVFLEDELTLPKNHKLVIGARLDYTTAAGPIFCPRINYKWNSNDKNNAIRVGMGSGYRVPNLMNEGFGAMNGSRKIEVEERLKPEQTICVNANYTRVQKLRGGILNFEIGGFYTYFFNMVNPDYDEEPGYIEYANSKGGAMASGFSVNADFTFNYPLKVGVGFTYTHVFELEENEDGEKEKEIPAHSPPFVANFFLSYTFAAPQLTIDYTGNLVSPMLLATVPDDFRPSKSKWYTIQNIQLTKKFSSGVEIYLGLKNFFNFIQKDPILRPFDPYNKNVTVDNPNNYRFDTTYGFTFTEGIKGFAGIRYTLQ